MDFFAVFLGFSNILVVCNIFGTFSDFSEFFKSFLDTMFLFS